MTHTNNITFLTQFYRITVTVTFQIYKKCYGFLIALGIIYKHNVLTDFIIGMPLLATTLDLQPQGAIVPFICEHLYFKRHDNQSSRHSRNAPLEAFKGETKKAKYSEESKAMRKSSPTLVLKDWKNSINCLNICKDCTGEVTSYILRAFKKIPVNYYKVGERSGKLASPSKVMGGLFRGNSSKFWLSILIVIIKNLYSSFSLSRSEFRFSRDRCEKARPRKIT